MPMSLGSKSMSSGIEVSMDFVDFVASYMPCIDEGLSVEFSIPSRHNRKLWLRKHPRAFSTAKT
jgi:hypothetical protein